MTGQYRVRALKQRRNQPDKNAANFVITVPASIGRKIVGREFTFQLTDEGMLYSIVGIAPTESTNPNWLNSFIEDREDNDA